MNIMNNGIYSYVLILLMSVVTIALRFSPFVLIKNTDSKIIRYYGNILPGAIMAMLVVFCLKDTAIGMNADSIGKLVALVVITVMQYWKDDSILSIISGTITYMLIINIF